MIKKILLILILINESTTPVEAQIDTTRENFLKKDILLILNQDTELFKNAIKDGNKDNAYLTQMIILRNTEDSVYKRIQIGQERITECLKKHIEYEDSVNSKMYYLIEISNPISSNDTFEILFQDNITIIQKLMKEFTEMEIIFNTKKREWSEMTNLKNMHHKK